MKKLLTIIFCLILGISMVAFGACSNDSEKEKPDNNSIPAITLDCSEKVLKVDQTFTLNATVTNSSEVPMFSSSNESVAVVDSNGNVRAMSIGDAIIRVVINNAQATCTISVVNESAPLLKINLSSTTVFLGYTRTLVGEVKFNGQPVQANIIYNSSNNEVASVSDDGVITGNTVGTCKISASCTVESVELYEEIEITVKSNMVFYMPKEINVTVYGDTKAMSAEFDLYKDGKKVDSPEINYKIADSTIAEYDETNNQIVGKKVGKTTIIAEYLSQVWESDINVTIGYRNNEINAFDDPSKIEGCTALYLGAGTTTSEYYTEAVADVEPNGGYFKVTHIGNGSMALQLKSMLTVEKLTALKEQGFVKVIMPIYVETVNIQAGTTRTFNVIGVSLNSYSFAIKEGEWTNVSIPIEHVIASVNYENVNYSISGTGIHKIKGTFGVHTEHKDWDNICTLYLGSILAEKLTIQENEINALDTQEKVNASLLVGSGVGKLTQSFYEGTVGDRTGKFLKADRVQKEGLATSQDGRIAPQIYSYLTVAQLTALKESGYAKVIVPVYVDVLSEDVTEDVTIGFFAGSSINPTRTVKEGKWVDLEFAIDNFIAELNATNKNYLNGTQQKVAGTFGFAPTHYDNITVYVGGIFATKA